MKEVIVLTKVHPVSSGLEDIVNTLKICDYIVCSVHEVASCYAVPFVYNTI